MSWKTKPKRMKPISASVKESKQLIRKTSMSSSITKDVCETLSDTENNFSVSKSLLRLEKNITDCSVESDHKICSIVERVISNKSALTKFDLLPADKSEFDQSQIVAKSKINPSPNLDHASFKIMPLNDMNISQCTSENDRNFILTKKETRRLKCIGL